jgi:hypothetical protein
VPKNEKLALEALRSAVPWLQVRPVHHDARADAVMELPTGPSLPLRLRWAGLGFPRDVERALLGVEDDTGTPIVVAGRSLSPGAKELLARRHVSWVTETGAARLHLGSVFVERDETRSSPPLEHLGDRPRWTPAIAAVAETILTTHAQSGDEIVPSTTLLATHSARSLGSVTAALQEFDRMRWTTPPTVSRGPTARRRIADATSMLDSWAGWTAEHARAVRYHSAHRQPDQTARAIREAFSDAAAFGGRFAADRIAPYSSDVRTLRCYVDVDLDVADRDARLSAAGLTRSDESRRVEVVEGTRSVMSMVTEHRAIRIVSPVRVFADLLHDGVRGADAAAHLREVALRF